MRERLLLITLALLITACGDLFNQGDEDSRETFNQFSVCELDVEAFSYILEKDISGDIECLRENLDLFIDTVETDRPGYISKNVMKDSILNGPFDIDKDTVDILDSVFDISHIILGTERDYIIKDDVSVLLDFLKFFNKHIWRTYRYFVDPSPVNYSRHLREREIVFSEISLISKELKKLYKKDRPYTDRIGTEGFILNFFQGKIDTLEKIRSLMFLKRVFLGGEVWDLTHHEVDKALDIIPSLAQVAFDMAKIDRYQFDNEQQRLIKVFLRDLDLVANNMFFKGDEITSVFDIYDVIYAVKTMAPNSLPFDISKYPKEIMKLKDIILGSEDELITPRQIVSALSQAKYLLSEADLFYRVYDFYREDLEDKGPITHSFSDFPVRNSLEKEFLDHFARIAKDYKFTKGSLTSAYYTYGFHRNENAFFQTSALEYLMELAMRYYGRKNPMARVGGVDMTLDDTVDMIKDFKWFLRDFGIINIGRKGGGEIEGVADNLVLMSTLFQYQSNGCDSEKVCMEVPEITEFLLGLLTAVEVKDFFTDTMIKLCRDNLDQYDRIEPECFRNNFLNVIETPIPGDGRAIADYMPYMHNYIKSLVSDLGEQEPITNSEAFMKFITETETFTRSCMYYDDEKTEEVYLKVNDAFAVYAGLLNVESTLLRFDLDQNNTVDAYNSKGQNEVLNAYYKNYKGALVALTEGRVGSAKIAKLIARPVFLYLVKFGEVPSTDRFSSIWKFVRFIVRNNKSADISRTTIATMLKTISEQSGGDHPYKCDECFRDPTFQCIPEGDDWEL